MDSMMVVSEVEEQHLHLHGLLVCVTWVRSSTYICMNSLVNIGEEQHIHLHGLHGGE